MKIGVILEDAVTVGGGFNQGLNAVLQIIQVTRGVHTVTVYTTLQGNQQYLKKLQVDAILLKIGFYEKFLWYAAIVPTLRWIQRRIRRISKAERLLIRDQVDLIYFVAPSRLSLAFQKTNIATTVWDICHRDWPEFPEARDNFVFQQREESFQNMLGQAVFTVCDSPTLAGRLASFYGLDRDRLLVMPFRPSPFLAEDQSERADVVLPHYGLDPGYYFYPAQFWAHKNHTRILQALALLKERGRSERVVFSGGIANSRNNVVDHLRAMAARLGVADQVTFTGFVPPEHMRGLYEGASVVVVPTYFGPTNLPPLEAWALEKPLIYSTSCADHAGDAALLVDPNDAAALADAMADAAMPEIAAQLVARGRSRLRQIGEQRLDAEKDLLERLNRFAMVRQCW